MRTLLLLPAALIALVALSACNTHRHPTHAHVRQLLSPNGEPIGTSANASCSTALTGWFQRADLNHDGMIDRAEFEADADRYFKAMDLDHNGYIDTNELSQYRLHLPPGMYIFGGEEGDVGSGNGHASPAGENGGGIGRHGGGGMHGGGRRMQGGGDHGSGNRDSGSALGEPLVDPVMSADTNVDFKVSRDEWAAQTARNFIKLDTKGNGRLTLDDVTASCKNEKDGD